MRPTVAFGLGVLSGATMSLLWLYMWLWGRRQPTPQPLFKGGRRKRRLPGKPEQRARLDKAFARERLRCPFCKRLDVKPGAHACWPEERERTGNVRVRRARGGAVRVGVCCESHALRLIPREDPCWDPMAPYLALRVEQPVCCQGHATGIAAISHSCWDPVTLMRPAQGPCPGCKADTHAWCKRDCPLSDPLAAAQGR